MDFFSRVSFPNLTGAVTEFPLPFPYLDASHLHFYALPAGVTDVEGYEVSAGVSLLSSGVAQIVPAPYGVTIEIRRETPQGAAVATFRSGTISSALLNASTTQLLYLTQEAADAASSLAAQTEQRLQAINAALQLLPVSQVLTNLTNLVVQTPAGQSTLIQVLSDHGRDITRDIELARLKPGYVEDGPTIQAAWMASGAISIQPGRVGALDIRSPVRITRPGARYTALGGAQDIPWARHPMMVGPTLELGAEDSSKPAIACFLHNLMFTHDGRLGGQYGSTGYPLGTLVGRKCLPGEAHLVLHGASQGAIVQNLTGWGAAGLIYILGCNGLEVRDVFNYGGIFDKDYSVTQESEGVVIAASGSVHGNNTRLRVIGGELYGNSKARSLVTVGSVTCTPLRRVGPSSGVLIRSCEDYELDGVLIASMAEFALGLLSDSATSIIFNGKVTGCDLDESGTAPLGVRRANSAWPVIDGLDVVNTRFNGQIVAKYGGIIYSTGDGTQPSMRDFTMTGGAIRATLGAGLIVDGCELGRVVGTSVRGYNCAGSEGSDAGGIVLSGTTRLFDVAHCAMGGGVNGLDDPYAPDQYNIAANGTKYGLAILGTGAKNTASRLKALPFGKSGGTILSGTPGSYDY